MEKECQDVFGWEEQDEDENENEKEGEEDENKEDEDEDENKEDENENKEDEDENMDSDKEDEDENMDSNKEDEHENVDSKESTTTPNDEGKNNVGIRNGHPIKGKASDKKSSSQQSFFKQQLYEWHCSLLKQLIESMQSEEYTTRNNAVIFVKGILSSYPIIDDHADKLYEKVSEIASIEKREDIKLAFNALRGLIKSRKVHQLTPWEFYEMDETEKKLLVEKRKQKQADERKKQAEELRIRREKSRKLDQERRKREVEKAKVEAEKARKTTIKKTEGSSVVPYGLVGLETAKRAGNGSAKSLKKEEVQGETTQKEAIQNEIQKKSIQKEIQKGSVQRESMQDKSIQNKSVQKDSIQKEPMNTESKSNARISTNTKSADEKIQ